MNIAYRPTRKHLIIAAILVVMIGGWIARSYYQKAQTAKAEAEAMKYTVERADIQSQVKVTATASLVNEQNLSFAQEGKITRVLVNVGDEVQAGDILAELAMDDYYNAMQTAELELENAQLGLQKLLNNDTSVREAQLRSQLHEVVSSYAIEQEQYTILQQQLATALQQKKDQLTQWERDYALAEKSVQLAGSGLSVDIATETEQTSDTLQARQQTIDSIVSSLRTSIGDAEAVVVAVDKIFGASDRFDDESDAYYSSLSAKNTGFKKATQKEILALYTILELLETRIDQISIESSDADIYQVAREFYEEMEGLINLCDSAADGLDMTDVGSAISESELAGYVVTVASSRTSAAALRTQLQTFASSVNSLLSESLQSDQLAISVGEKELAYDREGVSLQKQAEDIRLLKQEIATLEQDHTNQLTRQQAQITILGERRDALQKELDDLLDGADAYDIQQQQNLVRQAELRLERARDQQDDYQIEAEFDGRVRTVDIVEGEQYELDDRKFIVIENPNLIELKLQVSQIDIVKIHEKDPVTVTFDAYPNTPIEAEITSRNVNPEPNGRGGVFYEAIIVLEKQDLEILAGMSALVTVTTDESMSTLVVPTLAIVQQGDKQYVYRYEGDEYVLHEVEVGVTNNFQAEIVSGLMPGDIIKASILDDEVLHDMGIDDASASPFG